MNAISTMLKASAAVAMTLCSLGASAAVNYIADPNPENMVSELSAVTLTFPDASAVDMGSQYQNVVITAEDFRRTCTLEYGEADNQMVVSFNKIGDKGTYTLSVPADAITADGTPLEAFDIVYTVGQEVASNATLLPTPGDVEWLAEIVFYDPDVETSLSINSSAGSASVLTPSFESIELVSLYDWQVGNGRYRFRLRDMAVEPGTYTVMFPEDYFYYSDASWNRVYLPAYKFTYEVKGGELTKVETNPSMTKPTINFNFLDIEFPGYTTVALNPNVDYTSGTVKVFNDNKEESSVTTVLLTNFTIEGNKASYINNYTDFITPGHYHLTIPEGSFLLGEEQTHCTPFPIEFEVVAPKAAVIEITPANGSTVSMLNGAVVTFPEIAKVDFARSPSMTLYKVTEVDGEEKTVSIGGAYSTSAFTRLSDNSFQVTFSGMATEDGDYRIVLKENSFVYEGGFNQEYSVDVKFVAPKAPAFTMSPDNAVPQDRLQVFTVTFPEESVVKVNAALSNKTATLYAGEEMTYYDWGGVANQAIGSTSEYTAVEGTANSFTFKLSNPGLDPGKYFIHIPAGVFLMGEDENNFNGVIDVVYECTGEGLDKLEVTPSEPVNELSKITIKFINETSIKKASDYTGFTLYKYVEGQSYGTYLEYISGDNLQIEGNTLILTLANPITEEGTYYIEIGNYSLLMSDGETQSTAQKVYFTVDPNAEPVSVAAVEAVQENGRIFTVTGLEVKEMKTPGLYIVNGKKVIVK